MRILSFDCDFIIHCRSVFFKPFEYYDSFTSYKDFEIVAKIAIYPITQLTIPFGPVVRFAE
jgi:hypothetical protein